MKGRFREASRDQPRKKPPSSTREDRENLAKACFWTGTATSAEFLHLLNSTFHCSGRGSEVSLIIPTGTSSAEVNESIYRYRVIEVELNRQKDNPIQQVQIYPDRDGVLEDWYFSLIYMLVVVGCDHEYMFPKCSAAALAKRDGKSSSTVPSLWKSHFDELLEALDDVDISVNKSLRSHCNKRGSQQAMAESPTASGLPQHFRAGWRSAANTLLKYISGSLTLERHAAKAQAKWTAKLNDHVLGGQPVTFNDVLTASPTTSAQDQGEDVTATSLKGCLQSEDRDKLLRFSDALFEDDTTGLWVEGVRELLVSTLLLRYDQFTDVLRSHPFACPNMDLFKEFNPDFELEKSQDFDLIQNHVFVCRVNQALTKASADPTVFKRWCDNARNGFLCRNLPGIPIESLSLHGGKAKKVMIDVRTFTDHFNLLASVTQSTHIMVQELGHRLNDVTEILRDERWSRAYHHNTFHEMSESIRVIRNHFIPPIPETGPPPPLSKGQMKFSISMKALGKAPAISDTTTMFFVDNFPAGYLLDQKSWKDDPDTYPKPTRDSLIRLFAAVKCAVKMTLLHAPSFPSNADKKSIRRMAKLAEEKLRNDLKFDKQETITHGKIQKHPKTTSLHSSLSLPTGLPDEYVTFFSETA